MTAPQPEQGPKQLAYGQRAMVSSSHPAVTAAAVEVLRAGGNAVDAMLTAMTLQQVVEPQMSTIAGGFAMLHWDATTRQATYLNANLDHPTNGKIPPRDIAVTSGQRIGVPATVAGMQAAAERFGTRPWASYFAPAIAAAEDGFPIYSFLYGEMASAFTMLTHYPSGRERYTPDGYLPTVGTIWRQPQLAATLRRIAEPDGAAWFQAGPFASQFAAAVRETGGTMTAEEIAAYEPRWDEPTRFTFQGQQLVGSPPPDTGGLYVSFVLGVLAHCDLPAQGHWRDSPRALALIARTLALADDLVGRYCHDPRAFAVPTSLLLDPAHLAMQAQLLEQSFPHVDLTPPTAEQPPAPGTPNDPQKTDSNQLVIVDEQGNWVTMLHTVYGSPFGTGLVVAGVGVNTGNGFPGVAAGPGRRIIAPLASLLVLRDDQPYLALGTPSYPPPYIALTLLNHLVYGEPLNAAIEAPRFRLDPSAPGPRSPWNIGRLSTETRLPETTIAGLRRFGIEVHPLGDFNWHVGSVQAVLRDPATGQLVGAADSRRGGYAAGY